MKLLVAEAILIAPGSPYNGKTCDILIDNGIIESISSKRLTAPRGCKVVKAKGLYLSPGWFDMHVHIPDPGFEYKESVSSACEAAAAGGFTAMAVSPQTQPPVHSKSEVKYLLKHGQMQPVWIYPIGAISQNLDGKELAELYDMKQAGAAAFSEGDKPLAHAGLMLRALQYARNFDGLIISRPHDKEIAGTAMVNESGNTTRLGLKGIPAIAESTMVARDIELARYSGSRVHFSKISTAAAVDLIRKAKKEKLEVSCDVSVNNLVLTDAALNDYNSHLKLTPPLRSDADLKALIKGLKDGTIDAIVSDHNPQDKENKDLEFDYAAYGAIGLQTLYAVLNTYLGKDLSREEIIEKIAINPRRILGIAPVELREKETAEFTLFDPNAKWKLNEKSNRSKSANSVFFDMELTGKPTGIFSKGQWISNENPSHA